MGSKTFRWNWFNLLTFLTRYGCGLKSLALDSQRKVTLRLYSTIKGLTVCVVIIVKKLHRSLVFLKAMLHTTTGGLPWNSVLNGRRPGSWRYTPWPLKSIRPRCLTTYKWPNFSSMACHPLPYSGSQATCRTDISALSCLSDWLKGQSSMWPRWPGHYLCQFEKRLPQTRNQIYASDTSRNPLQSCLMFHSIRRSFTENLFLSKLLLILLHYLIVFG